MFARVLTWTLRRRLQRRCAACTVATAGRRAVAFWGTSMSKDDRMVAGVSGSPPDVPGTAAKLVHKPASKMFNDPVHGNVYLHGLCVRIIDTPQFQRLRDLKQLGTVYQVFPMGSHNRFEHSLGVSFLAGVFAEKLRKNHPELGITGEEVLCCKVAGLCHDLGHGVLSHSFDAFARLHDPDWTHEKGSLLMLDHLLLQNPGMCVWAEFQRHGLDEAHLHFVKELILGSPDEAPEYVLHQGDWKWAGRPGKEFLFQVVANKANGIDVDKFDYFMRDAHNLGIPVSFDAYRLIRTARVRELHGALHVCFPEKEAWNVYEMFHTRYNLHRRAYQHRVAGVCSHMKMQALKLADAAGYAPLVGADGQTRVRLADAVRDMAAYTNLTDSVLHHLRAFTTDPALEPARALLNRVLTRDLYAFVGECILGTELDGDGIAQDELARRVKDRLCERAAKGEVRPLEPSDLEVVFVCLDYGMDDRNPVDLVGFFKDSGPGHNMPAERVSRLLPTVFSEQYLRMFVKQRSLLDSAQGAWDACRDEWAAGAAP